MTGGRILKNDLSGHRFARARLFLWFVAALVGPFLAGVKPTGAEADLRKSAGDGDCVILASTRFQNLYQVTTNVLSGSAPESDDCFAELAQLGVKTVISVDGGAPDVRGATKHGLRYVHLPFGYDSIPPRRIVELTKAATFLPGPFYVHCHHGLHRGPAAVAIICEATAGWTTNRGVEWLKQAGTSPDYGGLYSSVIGFCPPTSAALHEIGALPEKATTSPLVDTMVAVDMTFDRLKLAEKAGWPGATGFEGRLPVQDAVILWELMRELVRTDDTSRRPDEYRTTLSSAVDAAGQLLAFVRDPTSGPVARSGAMQTLTRTCSACHKQYRN